MSVARFQTWSTSSTATSQCSRSRRFISMFSASSWYCHHSGRGFTSTARTSSPRSSRALGKPAADETASSRDQVPHAPLTTLAGTAGALGANRFSTSASAGRKCSSSTFGAA